MGLFEDRTFIIAEAGVNHNGNLSTAKQLIDAAASSGADAVKFQTFKADELVCENAEKADYQRANTGNNESQLSMLKKLELPEAAFVELKNYCDQRGIVFLSTPFDIDSLKFLISIGISMVKIPSGEITNYPLLREIGKSGLDVILSTGMCELEEVNQAISVLKEFGTKEITVLQCNTEYPTPFVDANLRAMLTLGRETGCRYGYSDHTEGTDVAIAAVALGACIIEKHFTLDKMMKGPDHIASIEPKELSMLVTSVRNVEKALGTGIKSVSKSERKNRSIARKSIVAKKTIHKGEMFSEDNLTTKRPGNGISPMHWNDLIGRTSNRDFQKDEVITI